MGVLRSLQRRIATGTLAVGRDRRGSVALEFILVMPFMAMMLFGIVKFGLAINNRLTLTDATRAAVRQLAVSRENTTPFTNTVNSFNAAAPLLTTSSVTLVLKINGTTCTSDSACKGLLATSSGLPATVNATYPCDLSVLGQDFAPGCTLNAQTVERIE